MGDEAEALMEQDMDYCALEMLCLYKPVRRYKSFKDTSKPHRDGKYRCARCGRYKPPEDFYKDKRVPCGIRNRCKTCYHKKNKE